MRLVSELRRRNVLRMAVLYVVAAWLIMQVAEVLIALAKLPDWIGPTTLILLAVGFPIAVIVSWFYEITPAGISLEKDVEPGESITHVTGRRLDFLVISLLCAAVILFAYDKWWMPGPPDQSIAVLPFENMSDDPANEYFSDGISEELLNLLAKIPQLTVISRSSSFSFKGQNLDVPTIAARLNVAHVLEGSVRKDGNRVRITAQLINARSDSHLWSETYDRDLDDIFAIQDEIAEAVVVQLKVTLLSDVPRVQDTDPEAYALYLQANHLLGVTTPESLQEAVALFKEVLAIDPGYVPAWLRLGVTYDRLGSGRILPLEEAQELSFQAFERALDISPSSAQALNSLAWKLSRHRGDLVTAAHFYERALSADPSDTGIIGNISMFLSSLGRMEDSIKFGEYQVSRDPANAVAYNNLGMRYRFAGHLDKAEESFSTALRLSPTLPGLNYELGITQLLAGNNASAIRAFEDESIAIFKQVGMAMAFHNQGEHALSLELLNELIGSYGEMIPYYIAHIMAYRGDLDDAFEWLETAKLAGAAALSDEVHIEPLLANIHADPRWLPFLESIGKSPARLDAIEFNVTLPE